jgi:hypothetical protein
MAKVSKLNIAITGDSKGFTAATEKAAKSMKKLSQDTAATKVNLGSMKGGFNQTAEALAKFGVQGRSLQMLGGLSGIASMGAMGATLAGAGLAIAGATAAVSSVVDMVQSMPEQRKRAIEALKMVARDDRNNFAKFGLTRGLAEGAAGQRAPSATTGMGIQAGMNTGFASQNSVQSRLLSTLFNDVPGAIGIMAGMRIGGASSAQASLEAGRALMGESTGQQLMNTINVYNDGISMWNKMKGWASF